jgi:hypothetical protein
MDLDPGGPKNGGSGSGFPTLPERRNWKLVIGKGFTFSYPGARLAGF